MKKAILFDFWGTLVENGVRSPIKQVRVILRINEPFSSYVSRMEKAMMTKEFPTLRDAFGEVCQEFNIDCNEDAMQELIGMWNKSWMLAQPYDQIEETLRNLKKKYQLILVSNTDNFSLNNVLKKFEFEQYFDHIFLSCKMGLIKTDEEFLKQVLEQTNLDVNDCVLVGDSMHSDMAAAKIAGMESILVDRYNRRDFPKKVSQVKWLERVL